jgi:hypothetical protein
MQQTPDWKIHKSEFVEELRAKWTEIKVNESVPGTYVLRWEVELNGRILLGGVQSDYHTLTIDGGAIASIAEFLIWYRELVPKRYPLYLYKGSKFDNPISLSVTTSKDELVTALTNY